MNIITCIYTTNNKRVVVDYMANDEHEFTAMGDVSDHELLAIAASEGGDLDGWECERMW